MFPEKKKARPAYLSRIKDSRADEIYINVLKHLTAHKLYRDPSYTAARLASDLQVNVRYISSAVALATGKNYAALVNGLRLRDACKMLRSPRFAQMTAEEIGLLAGFASRHAFYLAFHRLFSCTPRAYREGQEAL